MSDVTEAVENKEFSIEIKISNANLQYRSDFNEAETIFWIEAVKNIIMKNAFDKANLEANWLTYKKNIIWLLF